MGDTDADGITIIVCGGGTMALSLGAALMPGNYVDTPPYVGPANRSAACGHVERTVGKRVYCTACGLDKPARGGWNHVCVPVPVKERPLVRR
jgi:hypothetical protein